MFWIVFYLGRRGSWSKLRSGVNKSDRVNFLYMGTDSTVSRASRVYQLCKSVLIAILNIPIRFLTRMIIIMTLVQKGVMYLHDKSPQGWFNWLKELQHA